MNRNSKKEIFWVLGVFLLAVGIAIGFIREDIFAKENLEVQLYDTYFVLDLWFLMLTAFLFLLVVTYSIKEGFKKFRRVIPNLILSISIIGNILIITYIINFFSLFNSPDWLYSHSDLAEAQEPLTNPLFLTIRILMIVQFLLLAGLFLLAIRTGVLSKRQKSSPSIGWRS